MNTPEPSARYPRVTRRGARIDWIKFDAELARDGSVDPVDKALYAAIASFADTETRETPEVDPDAIQWDVPTRKRLAECIGRSVDTVDRATKRLEARRLLRVHRQADPDNPRRMLPSEYELLDHELWDQRAAERAARRAARRPTSGESAGQGGGRTGAATPGRMDAATPGRMDAATPGRTGAAEYKREKEGGEEEGETWGADAEGQGDGGFARAGAREGAPGETSPEAGGSAASETIPTPRNPNRPKTVKTRPRQMPPGYDEVRAAIPPRVARPGTQLYLGLRRAIADLLTGNESSGIPRRTPEQVIARINRRWYGEHAEDRCRPGYRPATDAEGDRPIKNPSSWLAAAILAQDCPDLSCEDGVILGTGQACVTCRERRAEQAAARRASEEMLARWEGQRTVETEHAAPRQAYEQEAQEAERQIRQRLAGTGMYGTLLDHRVGQEMARWRLEHPAPVQSAGAAAGAPW